MPRGFFITLEGLDGSGKTTQIKRLAAWLKERGNASQPKEPGAPGPSPLGTGDRQPAGIPAPDSGAWEKKNLILIRQPGGTATGDRIRSLLLDSRSAALAPMAEMALMFADRAQAISEVIQPALDDGKIVLCDRFTDSTEAYQGGGRQLGSAAVLELHRVLCSNLQPDLTLLLLPPLELALVRARRRNRRETSKTGQDENRFEQEQDAFYRRVREKYSEIAAREPTRVVLIEGNLSIDEVHHRIIAAVAERLLASGRIGFSQSATADAQSHAASPAP